MIVSPSAKQAMAAIMGSSSIRVGMMGPLMTVPWRALLRTRRSAVGSPSDLGFSSVMLAPMSRHT